MYLVLGTVIENLVVLSDPVTVMSLQVMPEPETVALPLKVTD